MPAGLQLMHVSARGLAWLAAVAVFLPAGASGLAALLWLAAALVGLLLGQWSVRQPGSDHASRWLLLWVTWVLGSALWSAAPWREWPRHASHAVMLLAIPAMAASIDARTARRGLQAFVGAAVLLGLAWCWHAWRPWPAGVLMSSMVHYVGNKSISNGVLMALAVALALHLGCASAGARRAVWWIAALFIAAVVWWRSPSRTAQGALLLLPLAWAWWQTRTARGRITVLMATAALGAAAWFFAVVDHTPSHGGLAARDAAGQLQASDDNRRALFAATWQMVQARPLIGHGLGSWQTLWQAGHPRADMREFNTAHSAPLQLWAEAGLVGLLLLALAVRAWIRTARAANLRGPGAPVALVLLAWALASLVNATLRDAVFTAPMVVLLALALAGTRAPPR